MKGRKEEGKKEENKEGKEYKRNNRSEVKENIYIYIFFYEY